MMLMVLVHYGSISLILEVLRASRQTIKSFSAINFHLLAIEFIGKTFASGVSDSKSKQIMAHSCSSSLPTNMSISQVTSSTKPSEYNSHNHSSRQSVRVAPQIHRRTHHQTYACPRLWALTRISVQLYH